jgi:cell wall-associated NlpC family hydrolase
MFKPFSLRASALPYPKKRRTTSSRFLFIIIVGSMSLSAAPAIAAHSLSSAQKEVDRLRTLAATQFESANETKIRIAQLQKETKNLRRNVQSVRSKRNDASKILARIAIDRYRNDGFTDGFALLFSGNPTRYLADAATLDIIARRYARSLRSYETYQQRLLANQLVLTDKIRRVRAEQKRLSVDVLGARVALSKAEKVLSSLGSADRIKLVKADRRREQKILTNSKKVARSFVGDSTRGSIALKFALQQIGDIYVWGGSGPARWDCSGLTLRAFQRAGVSLPHSAAIQFNYGKSIPYKYMKPGDLVFYGVPISHVAIYMGGGNMVQAPRAGKKVEVVSFTLQFGYKPFRGAKRL